MWKTSDASQNRRNTDGAIAIGHWASKPSGSRAGESVNTKRSNKSVASCRTKWRKPNQADDEPESDDLEQEAKDVQPETDDERENQEAEQDWKGTSRA